MVDDLIQNEIDNSDILEECSLYRAVRWIAFGERPIYMFELYPKRVDIEKNVISNKYHYTYKLNVEWKDNDDEAQFYRASEILLLKLKNNILVADGVGLSEEFQPSILSDEIPEHNYRKYDDKHTIIPAEFWNGVTKGNEWLISQTESFATERQKYCAYKSIHMRCAEIIKVFPTLNSKSTSIIGILPKINNAGRKERFDWKGQIFPEIAVYIHERGLGDSQFDVANSIYEICAEKYGEEYTPEPNTIIKNVIRPVYRRFKEEGLIE